jgi:hypothetical protein
VKLIEGNGLIGFIRVIQFTPKPQRPVTRWGFTFLCL